MTLSKPSITNNAEPSNQFKVSNGVPVEEVKCSDQLSHLKIFTESCFNNEEFTSLLAYQKIKIIQKMVSATPKLLMSQFFAFPLHNANVWWVFLLMQVQWTMERNILNAELLSRLLLWHFQKISWTNFYMFLSPMHKLQNKICTADTWKGIWLTKLVTGYTLCAYCIHFLIIFVLTLIYFLWNDNANSI